MRFQRFSLCAIAGGILAAALAVNAQAQTALSGRVTSAQEPTMEGVLVNLKREGSTITTTVATNEQGRYSFPADRLQPGKYTVSIRAVGYILDGPKSVEIPAGGNVTADLKLNKARNIHLSSPTANGWRACREPTVKSSSSPIVPDATPCSASSAPSMMSTSGSRCSAGWAAMHRVRRRHSRNCW